jgi:hypothetical protein
MSQFDTWRPHTFLAAQIIGEGEVSELLELGTVGVIKAIGGYTVSSLELTYNITVGGFAIWGNIQPSVAGFYPIYVPNPYFVVENSDSVIVSVNTMDTGAETGITIAGFVLPQ